MTRLCFISSTGGHFNQLMKIANQIEVENYTVITEKNSITSENKYNYLYQQDRKNIYFPIIFCFNIFLSIYYLFKLNPKVVVSTGAGVVIPFLVFAKILGKKIVYIESFAKVNSPTFTGRIVYKLRLTSDFYVQWPSMLKHYPKAIYKGAIF